MQAVVEKKQKLNTTLFTQSASQSVGTPQIKARWESFQHPFFTEFIAELVFILVLAGILYVLAWVSV